MTLGLEKLFTTPHPRVAFLVLFAAAAVAPFAWRVNTDPSVQRDLNACRAVGSGPRTRFAPIVVLLHVVEPIAASSPWQRWIRSRIATMGWSCACIFPSSYVLRVSFADIEEEAMKNILLRGSLSFAISCLTAAVLVAQEPPITPQVPTTPEKMVTAQGCLKQEKDVPGAKPNVAERAGVGEDFILTQAKLTKGGSGSGAMYKISGLDDEKLRSMSNQRVEVQGRLLEKTMMGAIKPTTPGPTTPPDEVQEIRATSIKMLAATCTAGTN